LQNDIRNLEAEIITLLKKDIIDSWCGFIREKPRIVPNAKMVRVGSNYQAEVFLYPIYDASFFDVIVEEKELPLIDGKRIYTAIPSSPGTYYWKGTLQIKGPKGIAKYPFEEKYEAF